MYQKFLRQKRAEYESALSHWGHKPKSLLYKTSGSMVARHRALLSSLPLERKTILDIGCGFGDIIPMIAAKATHFSYTGIDMVPGFIKFAARKYPRHHFLVGDYFHHPLAESFDIVLASGILSSNFPHYLSYRKRFISLMFAHCRLALAFDVACCHPAPTPDIGARIAYADTVQIIAHCLSLTEKISFTSLEIPSITTFALFR